MDSLSSGSAGLSSGTFPFSISTFPSITCVSTPLAACTNFWRFQKKETKSKSTWAHYGTQFCSQMRKNRAMKCENLGSLNVLKSAAENRRGSAAIDKSNNRSSNSPLYLCNDEATGHSQSGSGSKVAGDHDTEACLWKPELWRAGIHDLVHHHHWSTAVSFGRLDWRCGQSH